MAASGPTKPSTPVPITPPEVLYIIYIVHRPEETERFIGKLADAAAKGNAKEGILPNQTAIVRLKVTRADGKSWQDSGEATFTELRPLLAKTFEKIPAGSKVVVVGEHNLGFSDAELPDQLTKIESEVFRFIEPENCSFLVSGGGLPAYRQTIIDRELARIAAEDKELDTNSGRTCFSISLPHPSRVSMLLRNFSNPLLPGTLMAPEVKEALEAATERELKSPRSPGLFDKRSPQGEGAKQEEVTGEEEKKKKNQGRSTPAA